VGVSLPWAINDNCYFFYFACWIRINKCLLMVVYCRLFKSIKRKKWTELMHFYPICDLIYLLKSNRACFSHSVTFVVHLHVQSCVRINLFFWQKQKKTKQKTSAKAQEFLCQEFLYRQVFKFTFVYENPLTNLKWFIYFFFIVYFSN
jgi:hypothetical protein